MHGLDFRGHTILITLHRGRTIKKESKKINRQTEKIIQEKLIKTMFGSLK